MEQHLSQMMQIWQHIWTAGCRYDHDIPRQQEEAQIAHGSCRHAQRSTPRRPRLLHCNADDRHHPTLVKHSELQVVSKAS